MPKGAKISKLYQESIEYKKTTTAELWRKDDSYGRCWILPEVGKKQIDKITENDIDNIIAKAFDKGKLSKKSLENIKGTTLNFIKWCRKKKLTTLRPEDVEIPATAKAGERQILDRQHLAILFSSDKTRYRRKVISDPNIHANRTIVLIGCCPGEALGIEKGNISGNIVNLRRSINIRGEETEGKNKNAQRRFYLPPLAKEEIAAQLREYPGNIRIFGDTLRERTLLSRWYAYCAYNNILHVTLYELRHTFVSIIKGLPEAEVKMLVGHSKSMDTTGIYSHEMRGDLERVSDKIQYIFANILRSEKMNAKLQPEDSKIS